MVEDNPLVRRDNEVIRATIPDEGGGILSESRMSIAMGVVVWIVTTALIMDLKPEFGSGNATGTGFLLGLIAFLGSEAVRKGV